GLRAGLAAPGADGDGGAVNDRLSVPLGPTSAGPASKVILGISNVMECPAGSSLVTLKVIVVVSVALKVTSSCGPGRLAVAVEQLPGVVGMPKLQIGTVTAPVSVAVLGTAHRSMVMVAAEAADPLYMSLAAMMASMSRILLFVTAILCIAGLLVSSRPIMARRRRSS